MIINHNLSAINANRFLKFKNWDVDKHIEKLSSGQRINRAADDGAGLAISEKMRAQIRGLRQAVRNAEDDISFIQTTEGYLSAIHSILQRIRELAVQAANGIYTAMDRMQIQVEVSQLVDEIDRVASHAQFNQLNMLSGRYARPSDENIGVTSMWFHIGPNMDQRERVYIENVNSQALGLKDKNGIPETAQSISLSSINQANANINILDIAINKVSKQRSDLGSYQNRLEFATQSLMAGYENLQAAESRIRDTDMAEATVNFIKDQILTQAGTAMLAQANAKSQLVLRLLQ